MYYAAAVLDPRVKTTLIREQCGNDANDYINRIRTYLKNKFGAKPYPAPLQNTLNIPANASLYHLGMLRRARQSNSFVLSDIDRFLDTPPIE
jgi:hypothetical protein